MHLPKFPHAVCSSNRAQGTRLKLLAATTTLAITPFLWTLPRLLPSELHSCIHPRAAMLDSSFDSIEISRILIHEKVPKPTLLSIEGLSFFFGPAEQVTQCYSRFLTPFRHRRPNPKLHLSDPDSLGIDPSPKPHVATHQHPRDQPIQHNLEIPSLNHPFHTPAQGPQIQDYAPVGDLIPVHAVVRSTILELSSQVTKGVFDPLRFGIVWGDGPED